MVITIVLFETRIDIHHKEGNASPFAFKMNNIIFQPKPGDIKILLGIIYFSLCAYKLYLVIFYEGLKIPDCGPVK